MYLDRDEELLLLLLLLLEEEEDDEELLDEDEEVPSRLSALCSSSSASAASSGRTFRSCNTGDCCLIASAQHQFNSAHSRHSHLILGPGSIWDL